MLATVVLIAVTIGCLAYLFMQSTKNYAKEVAKPLEQALVEAGAVKVCEGGDSGRGPDNKTPYYGATFKLKQDKAEAIRVAQQVTSKNGYSLAHASPTNRGFLDSVADTFIDDWYFDGSSKTASYSDLESGKVELSTVIYGAGSKNDCDQSTIAPGESTIGIGTRLPDFKR